MPGVTQRRRPMSEINVVPYIDVMLVLLVIFMVTAPLLAAGIQVDLPKASARPLDAPKRNEPPIVLSIDREGEWYLNLGRSPNTALDRDTALARVTAALRRDPERQVLVKGDRAADYGAVVDAMAMLQQAGASRLGFLTEPLAAPSPRRGTQDRGAASNR